MPQAPRVDIAPFARIATWNPRRMDGCRATRIETPRGEDLFLEQPLTPDKNGAFTPPVLADGEACIGLQWLEPRRLVEASLTMVDAPEGDARLEVWIGWSPWQGAWEPAPGQVEKDGKVWRVVMTPEEGEGVLTRKLRWIYPTATSTAGAAAGMQAYTNSVWETTELTLQREGDEDGEVEIYNGELLDSDGTLTLAWPAGETLTLNLRHWQPAKEKGDRTVLRLRLGEYAFGVAVDDVLSNGAVYVPLVDVYVTKAKGGMSLKEYRKKFAKEQTILDRVREMPEQTLEQSRAKARNPIQDNGPTMLSLACDNHKFIVAREGTINLEPFEVQPTLGSGEGGEASRYLHGDWLPIPVSTTKRDGVTMEQTSFACPYEDKSLGVSSFRLSADKPTQATLRLRFLSHFERGVLANVSARADVLVVSAGDGLLAMVEFARGCPQVEMGEGEVTLRFALDGSNDALVNVAIPTWHVPMDNIHLPRELHLRRESTRAYWERLLDETTDIEVPDPVLNTAIRASRVHCMVCARNDDNGETVAAWVASDRYGALESESHSVIRGMAMFGHRDFALRALEYFIRRYRPDGLLTTGYTIMGVGWHLQTLAQVVELFQASDWFNKTGREAKRVADWIVRQRQKTLDNAPDDSYLERGLLPPGVMADWNAFAYYYCLGGYYFAGLLGMARLLQDEDDGAMLETALDLRHDIVQAYCWTQARMPVVSLRDGSWIPGHPSQMHCPGPTDDYFPGEDDNRSWCYDVELGAHHLGPQEVLAPDGDEVGRMLDHMEDRHFLAAGWYDYDAEGNEADWFNRGGFSKVQPYYTRNGELYALRDDVKPFLRSYYNALFSLLNLENMNVWEHFNNGAAWDKPHETGYFLQQTRFMLAIERYNKALDTIDGLEDTESIDELDVLESFVDNGDLAYNELWLASLIPSAWLEHGKRIVVRGMPTYFGPLSYTLVSRIDDKVIEGECRLDGWTDMVQIVLRLRHPRGAAIESVTLNGTPCSSFDHDCVRFDARSGRMVFRVTYA